MNAIAHMPVRSAAIPAPDGPYYIRVCSDARGMWIVNDNRGSLSGMFRSRKAAMQFALTEAELRRCSVMIDCSGVRPEAPIGHEIRVPERI